MHDRKQESLFKSVYFQMHMCDVQKVHHWISVQNFDFAPGSEMRLSRTSRICGTRCRRTRDRAWSARGAKPAGRCGPCATWAMPRCQIRARFSTAPRPGMVQFGVFTHQTVFPSDVGKSFFRSCCHPTTCRWGALLLVCSKCPVDVCQC